MRIERDYGYITMWSWMTLISGILVILFTVYMVMTIQVKEGQVIDAIFSPPHVVLLIIFIISDFN